MISRWANKKPEAIALRRKGNSIKDIEKILGIPRSTLSGWLRSVTLTKKQREDLNQRHKQGLVTARVAAIQWHNAQKAGRIEQASKLGEEVLKRISSSIDTLELALAFLYLGEGSKKSSGTSLGSSDSRIAKFYIRCLRQIYDVPLKNIKCYLHLRADQDGEIMKQYWSKELTLPISNFGKSSFDKRTLGKLTYPHYKGVCLIECGRVDIQRRLMYIANGFCDIVSRTHANRAVSSVGRASA